MNRTFKALTALALLASLFLLPLWMLARSIGTL